MSAEHVAGPIHRVPSELGVRRLAQWLVVDGDEALLVDTGVPESVPEHIVPALRELGVEPAGLREVIISHADVDHYGGNAGIRQLAPGARIRAHPLDRALLERWENISGPARYGWYRPRGLDYDPAVWDWLVTAAGPDVEIDGDVSDGETVTVGGASLEVLSLPGHSPGHLGLWHAPTRTAIVADAVLHRGLVDLDGELLGPPPIVTAPGYRSSIARLQALAPARLETSHYAPVEGEPAVEEFLAASAAFMDALEASVRGALGPEPRPLPEIWEVANAELGPYRDMAVELGRSVGAELDDLVARGEVREEPGDGPPRYARA